MVSIDIAVNGATTAITWEYLVATVGLAAASWWVFIRKSILSVMASAVATAKVAIQNISADEAKAIFARIRTLKSTVASESREPTADELYQIGKMIYDSVKE